MRRDQYGNSVEDNSGVCLRVWVSIVSLLQARRDQHTAYSSSGLQVRGCHIGNRLWLASQCTSSFCAETEAARAADTWRVVGAAAERVPQEAAKLV
jgi:hypothetical protein